MESPVNTPGMSFPAAASAANISAGLRTVSSTAAWLAPVHGRKRRKLNVSSKTNWPAAHRRQDRKITSAQSRKPLTSLSWIKRSRAYRTVSLHGTEVSWAGSRCIAKERIPSPSHASRESCSQDMRQRGKSITPQATRGRLCGSVSVLFSGTALSAVGWTASPLCPRLKRMSLRRSRSQTRSTPRCSQRLTL